MRTRTNFLIKKLWVQIRRIIKRVAQRHPFRSKNNSTIISLQLLQMKRVEIKSLSRNQSTKLDLRKITLGLKNKRNQ